MADQPISVPARSVSLESRGTFGGPEPLETNYVLHPDGTDLIVAVHRRHLTVLDTLGTVRARFGRDGLGPGEFLSTTPAGTVADSIWVGDRHAARYTVYHPASGTFRTARLPVSGGRPRNVSLEWGHLIQGLLGDGRVLVRGTSRRSASSPAKMMIGVITTADSLEVLLLTQTLSAECLVPNRGRSFMLMVCQRALDFTAPNGQSITGVEEAHQLADGMALRLTRVAVSGDTLMNVVVALPAITVTAQLLDSLLEATARILDRPVTADGFDPPKRLGAVRYGHQGNDGTLWLGAPRTAAGQPWYLVTPEGTLAGEVVLDQELRIGAVARQGAWAVRDLENGDAELVRITIQP